MYQKYENRLELGLDCMIGDPVAHNWNIESSRLYFGTNGVEHYLEAKLHLLKVSHAFWTWFLPSVITVVNTSFFIYSFSLFVKWIKIGLSPILLEFLIFCHRKWRIFSSLSFKTYSRVQNIDQCQSMIITHFRK